MENLIKKEEKLEENVANKVFLIFLKYILHGLALLYAIYTLLGFLGLDAVIISYIANLSLLPWAALYACSLKFKFCYVHRLPLYYIMLNELITVIDYYQHIPDDCFTQLVLHSILGAVILFGYSFYYIKKLKHDNSNKTDTLAVY